MIAKQELCRFRMVVPAYPTFNIYSRIAGKTTALGPLAVATVVQHMPGFTAEVIDENNYYRPGPKDHYGLPDHNVLQVIRSADIIGLYGGLSSTIPRLFEVAHLYKQDANVVTIAGGQHFVEDNIRVALENDIDFVVIGEGENTIRELLTVIRNGESPDAVAGIAFMRNGKMIMTSPRPAITEFDDLPVTDFGLLHYAKMKLFPVGWIRGCGMNCEFCTVKGKPRSASPEHVLKQIATALEEHDARDFFIVDDLFGHNRRDTLRFCRLLADYQEAVGIKLDLTVQIRLDIGRDKELLNAMRKAGVNIVCIGFESPIPEELAAMDKRLKPEDMVDLARLYHEAGFLVHGMFIFGYPLPSGVSINMSLDERVRHFRRFIRKSRLDTIQVLLPVPLPGTELTARLKADNRILPIGQVGWEYYDGNFPLLIPDAPLTPEDMQRGIVKIMGRFYRFRYIFAIGFNLIIFPAMFLSLWNVRFAWRQWHRRWRNALIRSGGWVILRHWISHFRHDDFSQKLHRAETTLR